jgi:hypothetical protein
VTIKITVRYSSHVVGGIPPSPPEQGHHYAEYFEGKLSTSGGNVFPFDQFLLFILLMITLAILGSVMFFVMQKKKQTSAKSRSMTK